MDNMEQMQVTIKAELKFEVGHCAEYVSFKGAFEKDLIKLLKSSIIVTSDQGDVLDDEQEKDKIIQAILYGLKEKG